MKSKIWLGIILSLVVYNQLNAQNKEKKNIFEIIIGVNASNISNYEAKSLVSFTGGLYWEWKFSDRFAFQSNFLYQQRGERENGSVSELKLNYINMPMMLKYYPTDKLCFMTGVFWDYLLSADGNNLNKDDFKNSDFGIPIGISYDISKKIQLGLSYNFGLIDVQDKNVDSEKYRNNWGNLTLTYIFRQKK